MVQKLSFGQTVYTDRQTDTSETFTFPLLQAVIKILEKDGFKFINYMTSDSAVATFL